VLVPVTTGLTRAIVLLPVAWHGWELSKKRAILAHELSHVRRRDYWVRMVAVFNRCVYWFHPLAHLAVAELAYASEEASDHAGLLVTASRKRYAQYLLEIAASAQGKRTVLQMSVAGYGGRKELDRRFEKILSGPTGKDDEVCSRKMRLAGISLGVLAITLLVTTRFAGNAYAFSPMSPLTPQGFALSSSDGHVPPLSAAPQASQLATAVQDQAADGNQDIDAAESFERKTKTFVYRMKLTSSTDPVKLEFGANVSAGRVVWRLTDPSGAKRMSVQTTAKGMGWTNEIQSIPGEWTLTVQLEHATGKSWMSWKK
jgi:hypothetical protein